MGDGGEDGNFQKSFLHPPAPVSHPVNFDSVYDFIVVGSGIAGLSFALRAARHGRVLVLTKRLSWAGSTHLAQGGIASVMDPADSLDRHVQDTLAAGAGLCRKDRVDLLVSHGPAAVRA